MTTKKELLERAKVLGIVGRWRMTKPELEAAMRTRPEIPMDETPSPRPPSTRETTKKKLLKVAEELGVVGRTKMTKHELEVVISERHRGVFDRDRAKSFPKKYLMEKAKDKGVVGVNKFTKEELAKKIVEFVPRRREVNLCVHEVDIRSCDTCRRNRCCVHGRIKYFCKECGGSQVCKHDKLVFNCKRGCDEERREAKGRGHARMGRS